MRIDLHVPVRSICPHCLSHRLTVERSIWNALRSGFNVFACCLRYLGHVIASVFYILCVVSHPLSHSEICPQPYIESLPRIGLWRRCRDCGASVLDSALAGTATTCGACGYSLKGNTSGTCPECGWTIPGMTRTLLHYEQATSTRRSLPTKRRFFSPRPRR